MHFYTDFSPSPLFPFFIIILKSNIYIVYFNWIILFIHWIKRYKVLNIKNTKFIIFAKNIRNLLYLLGLLILQNRRLLLLIFQNHPFLARFRHHPYCPCFCLCRRRNLYYYIDHCSWQKIKMFFRIFIKIFRFFKY